MSKDSLLNKIRYRYYEIIPYDWRPSQIWYRIKCRFWHKYNVIKIKKLPSTWCDRDHVLFHACMQILVDFVEKEKPFEHFNTEASRHKESWDEIKKIYNWYKEYPEPYKSKEKALFDKLNDCSPWKLFSDTQGPWGGLCVDEKESYVLSDGTKVYSIPACPKDRSLVYEEINKLREEFDNIEQEMLERLIKVRSYMWT